MSVRLTGRQVDAIESVLLLPFAAMPIAFGGLRTPNACIHRGMHDALRLGAYSHTHTRAHAI